MSTRETGAYPARQESVERWHALARSIAADAYRLSAEPPAAPPAHPGRLVVLGTGIGVMGLSRDAEQRLRDADYVFYCVADPATHVWLRRLRPDAYDLYVLYDDRKRRYRTYMQMSEAILHYVRQGKKVAAVYYGHPGIFVLSTHRAVAIARREGHRAEMRPAVSALDCLCADLGVDPAYPGLQTFEATDLLLRRRTPDTSAHVVLWQVGLIGDLGFRRRGFPNRNFHLLIRYLQEHYGEDAPVTHYIAARYPTLPPTIEHYRLRELLQAGVRKRITGISTFYLPPREARPADAEMAVALGIMQPGQRPVRSPSPHRKIDGYGPRELEAIDELADFEVPPDYQYQEETGAAAFLLALADDPALRERYREDPRGAVRDFPGLSARERKLLASRDSGRVQLAAKGEAAAWSTAEQFVVDLLSKPSLAKAFNAQLLEYVPQTNGYQQVNAWIEAQGYSPFDILTDYAPAAANVQDSLLLGWSGVYATADSPPNVLAVIGNPASNAASIVYLNTARIWSPSFANGVLSWSGGGNTGNTTSGSLTFALPTGDDTSGFVRTVSGMVYPGSTPPAQNNFSATEQVLADNPLGVWAGEYQTQVSGGGAGPTLTVSLPTADNPAPAVALNGTAVTGFTFSGSQLSWDNGASQVTFALTDTPGSASLSGTISGSGAVTATSSAANGNAFQGQYVTQLISSGSWTPYRPLYFDGVSTVVISGKVISGATFTNRVLSWSGAGGSIDSGQLTFSVNSTNNGAGFTGFIWAAGTSQPSAYNFQGALSLGYVQSWSGTYATTLASAAGPTLFVQGEAPPQATNVFYNGQTVNYSFGGTLNGTVAGANPAIAIAATFAYAASGQTVTRTFTGTVATGAGSAQPWSSTSVSNDMTLWGGNYNTTLTPAGALPSTGAQLQVTAASADEYTVVLTDGTTTVTITNAVYKAQYSTLSWTNDTGTPGGNQYANAAIAFHDDATTQTKRFTGSYWAAGSQPPSTANWSGAVPYTPTPPAPPPDGGGGGMAWWVITSIVGGVAVVLGLGGYFLYRYLTRFAYQSVPQNAIECMNCKKEN